MNKDRKLEQAPQALDVHAAMQRARALRAAYIARSARHLLERLRRAFRGGRRAVAQAA